jgi:Uncharacterized protein family UPF0029
VPTYGLTTGRLRGRYYVDDQLARLTKQSAPLHIHEAYDRAHHLTVFTQVQFLRAQCWLWLKEKVELNEQVAVAKDEERNTGCWLARDGGRQLKVPGTDAIIKEGEPIHSRGSSFVARAVRLVLVEGLGTREQFEEIRMQVEKIVTTLKSIPEIARAAHPCVHVWRCRIGNDIHTGEFIVSTSIWRPLDLVLTTPISGGDDDGETRASVHIQRVLDGRNIENVLVVLTRYWNGVFLGPDRFE